MATVSIASRNVYPYPNKVDYYGHRTLAKSLLRRWLTITPSYTIFAAPGSGKWSKLTRLANRLHEQIARENADIVNKHHQEHEFYFKEVFRNDPNFNDSDRGEYGILVTAFGTIHETIVKGKVKATR